MCGYDGLHNIYQVYHPKHGTSKKIAAFEAEEVILVAGKEHTLELTEFMRALTAAGIKATLLTENLAQQLTVD